MNADALLSRFQSLPPEARVFDLSNRHITPDVAVELFERMAACDPQPPGLVGVDLDGNRMGTATPGDLRRVIRAVARLNGGRVRVRFGFEIGAGTLIEAMDAEEGAARHVDNVVPWWARDIQDMNREHARAMHALDKQHQEKMRELQLETERAKADTESAKADADRAKADAARAKADAARAREKAELAREDAANAKKDLDNAMTALTHRIGTVDSRLELKIRAMSDDVELRCRVAVRDMLVDGEILCHSRDFNHEGRRGEFDGIMVGSLDGEDVVVLMEAKTNVARDFDKAVKQCLAARDAWNWLARDEFPDAEFRLSWAFQRESLRMDKHRRRRVIMAIAGGGDWKGDALENWIAVTDEAFVARLKK